MKWNLRGEYIGDIEFVKDMELMLKIRYQVKGYCIALVLDSWFWLVLSKVTLNLLAHYLGVSEGGVIRNFSKKKGGGMKDKVVLVTGGGTGIGKAIAQRFIDLGAFIVITGRRESKLSSAIEELGKNAAYIVGDLSEPGVPKSIIRETVEKYGRLDVVVNNAGIGSGGLLIDTTDSEIESVFKTNLFAPLALIREALPELIKTKGSVINISSILSKGVMPQLSVYSAFKAGLDHATRVLAAEYGSQGVRVNAVAPGFTATEMTQDMDPEVVQTWEDLSPFGRIGQPEEVATVVTFLASEDARWVTGQIVQAGGGVMM
jgi:NAD(P)-dependent dehydrogenase (short-subunit alcohol dehydrogenase family)